jgi:hypothetical protein
MTKPASFASYATTIGEQLQVPEQFWDGAEALHGVPRYFGPMAREESALNKLTKPTEFNNEKGLQ